MKENSRRSYHQIANDIGKTEATVRRRVKKLEKNGIIKKYTTEFSINSNPNLNILVKIQLNLKDNKKILHELDLMEEITDIWRLSGDTIVFLKVKIPSMTQFNPIIEEKIALINGVKLLEACLILDVIK